MNLVILIIMLFSFIIHHRSFQIKKLPRRIVLELKRYASEFANDSPIVDTSNSIKLPPKRSREGLGFAKGYTGSSQKYILEYHQLSGLPLKKQFVVLGIETSCDDTGVGIVTSDGKILSNIVYSQYDIHQKFGGIVPGLAMAAHKDNIEKAIDKCLEVAGFQSMNDIDAIAVTKGPGLEICLRVGLRKAQNLAKEFAKPLVTVHHHEAHCLISRIAGKFMSADNSTVSTPIYDTSGFKPAVEFPFLAILASGGHTSIMLCKALGEYEVLGATLDDALGEAVDKASRLLGLQSNTSGGAAVEIAAKNGNPLAFPMSIPMKSKINCDFSYAGLKNSFRKLVEDQRKLHGIDDSSATSTNAPLNSMEETKNIIVSLPDLLYLKFLYYCLKGLT